MSDSLLYLEGSPVQDAEEVDRSVTPVWVYLGIFVLVVGGTITGFVASLLPLGSASLAVAMGTAVIQASMVAGFLMHLHNQNKVYAFLVACSVMLVGALWSYPLFDLQQGGAVNDEAAIQWKSDLDANAHRVRARMGAQGDAAAEADEPAAEGQ
jgi:caa(3)-type oxidase subunit IV